MAMAEGAMLPDAGVRRMNPVAVPAPATEVTSLLEARPGIEYGNVELVTLPTVIDDACPVLSKKETVPETALSLGLTRTICVVHPPPTAKCGKIAAAVD